jgi:hypothetical protein
VSKIFQEILSVLSALLFWHCSLPRLGPSRPSPRLLAPAVKITPHRDDSPRAVALRLRNRQGSPENGKVDDTITALGAP